MDSVLKKYSNLYRAFDTVFISKCIAKDGNSGLSINSKLKLMLLILLSNFISSGELITISTASSSKEINRHPDSITESDISVSNGISILSIVFGGFLE